MVILSCSIRFTSSPSQSPKRAIQSLNPYHPQFSFSHSLPNDQAFHHLLPDSGYIAWNVESELRLVRRLCIVSLKFFLMICLSEDYSLHFSTNQRKGRIHTGRRRWERSTELMIYSQLSRSSFVLTTIWERGNQGEK